jgi:hypothetical protein
MWDGGAVHDASSGEIKDRPAGDLCADCYEPDLTVFLIPDAVWDQIAGGASVLCLRCADARARKLGIELYWEAEVNEFPRDFRRRLQAAIAEHGTVLDRLADG